MPDKGLGRILEAPRGNVELSPSCMVNQVSEIRWSVGTPL